ncbi:hypothetical protein GCM10020331_063770 [Ectobacillus funiculus]
MPNTNSLREKGATGTFDILNNGSLKPEATYKVTPVGAWAEAKDIMIQKLVG